MKKSVNVTNVRYECAVLIPCYNEEITIGKVIDDFKRVLPEYPVFVYDNASTDRTAEIARAHGAIVRYCCVRGKANVVKDMLRDIKADCYLLVDGDDTYPAGDAQRLIGPILRKSADMTIGVRHYDKSGDFDRRTVHNLGNRLVNFYVNRKFGRNGHLISDVMTGYRAMSADFVRYLGIMSCGFELETEISIYALEHDYRVIAVDIPCKERPVGSFSKIDTVRDGMRILNWIYKQDKRKVNCCKRIV